MLKNIQSESNRNILTLLTGTTIAQAIPIAISPILTRIYSPEDFGLIAIFIAITYIIGSISNFNYELAIVLPDKEEDAINIFALSLLITLLITILTFIIVIFFNVELANLLNSPEISFWLYFIPVTVFFSGLFNALKYFNTRKKYYKDISNVTILKTVILSSLQILLGLIKSGPTGLFTGYIASNVFSNLKLLKNVFKDKQNYKQINISRIVKNAKKYSKFPKFTMPSTLFNVIAHQLPILLLGILFNSNIVGLYSLANKMIKMPVGLVGNAVGNVFYQTISVDKNNDENIKMLTYKTYNKLLLISIVPFSIMIVYSDLIFEVIFGDNWTLAGKMVQYLSFWFMLVFISSPISNLCFIYEKQKIALIFNIFFFTVSVISIFVGSMFFIEAIDTILILAITSSISWLIWLVYLLKLSNNNVLFNIFKMIISIVITSLILYFIRGLLIEK